MWSGSVLEAIDCAFLVESRRYCGLGFNKDPGHSIWIDIDLENDHREWSWFWIGPFSPSPGVWIGWIAGRRSYCCAAWPFSRRVALNSGRYCFVKLEIYFKLFEVQMLFWAPLSFTSPTVPLSQFSNDPNGHLSIGVQCPIDLDDRCSDWDDKSPWGRRLWEGTAAALFTFFLKRLERPFLSSLFALSRFTKSTKAGSNPLSLCGSVSHRRVFTFHQNRTVNRICCQLWPKWLTMTFSLLTIDFVWPYSQFSLAVHLPFTSVYHLISQLSFANGPLLISFLGSRWRG